MRRLLLLTLLAPAVALSQPKDLLGDPSPAEADSVAVAAQGLFSMMALADTAGLASRVEALRQTIEAARVEAEVTAPSPPSPTLHALGTTGLSILLPAGWDGPVSASEAGLPGYALYTVRNGAAGDPLQGVVIRVERVTGLNPLLRERFSRGQTSYGTHGATPVGPAAVPVGFGVEVGGAGMAGAAAYITRGATLWAVSVQAPAPRWAAHRAELLALFSAVRLP